VGDHEFRGAETGMPIVMIKRVRRITMEDNGLNFAAEVQSGKFLRPSHVSEK
jgi:hypothetical protein